MTAAALGAYIVFEDEAGFSMTPPRARTWGRRGHTPVVRVRGRSWRRWSIAAMCCYKQGETSRLIYRPRRHRKHKGKGRDSFSWRDYRDLAVRAHLQLKAPIVLVWDNLNTHLAAGMRQYADDHDWLTIVQLHSYAPDLNPAEGVWSLLRRGPLANTASPTTTTSNAPSAADFAISSYGPTSSTAALLAPDSASPIHPTTIRGDQ